MIHIEKKIVVNVDWKWITNNFCQKLNNFCEHITFEKFKNSFFNNDVDSLKFFISFMSIIFFRVSNWIKLCEKIFRDIFSSIFDDDDNESNDSNEFSLSIWSTTFLSICVQKKHFIRSINMQNIFELYFYQNDVKRRVFITFAQFGLCMSYKIIQRRMMNFVSKIEKKIKSIEQFTSIVITYDNFDFMKNRRDERIENIQTMRSIIIALLFHDRKFETNSLKKKMWRFEFNFLSAINIVKKLQFNEIDQKIFRFRFTLRYYWLILFHLNKIASFEIDYTNFDSIRRQFEWIFFFHRHVCNRDFIDVHDQILFDNFDFEKRKYNFQQYSNFEKHIFETIWIWFRSYISSIKFAIDIWKF